MRYVKLKLLLTGFGLFFLASYLLFFHQSTVLTVSQKNMCKAKSKALSVEFAGVLVAKYEDRNDHLVRKIEVQGIEGKFRSSFLESEASGFYEKLMIGDSVFKQGNKLDVRVIRDTSQQIHHLDYLCPN